MLSNENKFNETPLSEESEADGTLSGDNLSDSGLSAGTSLLGETPEVSMAVARALADSLTKITAYVPTTWVDNTEPDIDAEHLNHVEQGIMKVTNLMNSAVDVIKDLQTQVTTLNGEAILTSNKNAIQIGQKADINTFKKSGVFICSSNVTANTLLNLPLYNVGAFELIILDLFKDNKYILQIFINLYGSEITMRVWDSYSSEWGTAYRYNGIRNNT